MAAAATEQIVCCTLVGLDERADNKDGPKPATRPRGAACTAHLREVGAPHALAVLVPGSHGCAGGHIPQLQPSLVVCCQQAGLEVGIPDHAGQLGAGHDLSHRVVHECIVRDHIRQFEDLHANEGMVRVLS